MTRSTPLILLMSLATGFGAGCGEVASGVNQVSIHPTPTHVLKPQAPDEPRTDSAPKPPAAEAEKPAEPPKTTWARGLASILTPALAVAEEPADKPSADQARLVAIKFADLKARIAAHSRAKLIMVDVWSTTCPPCMENFPHVVAMNARYASQGLAVVSLSLDDPEDEKAIRQAEKFLRDKKATFTNLRLDEDPTIAYEEFRFNTLPAVLLFGPDGKELKRFTWDDPNNQFTYDEVEKTVSDFLRAQDVKRP